MWVDWEAIRMEYITTKISYRALSKKWGVDRTHIGRIAKRESWTSERRKYCDEVSRKIVQKVAEESSEQKANKLLRIQEAADSIGKVIEGLFVDAEQFHRHIVQIRDGERTDAEERVFRKTDTKAIKELTGALKDMTYILRNIHDLPTNQGMKSPHAPRTDLDLRLFDGSGADGGTAADAPTAPKASAGEADTGAAPKPAKALSPAPEMPAGKYGAEDTDIDALVKAIERENAEFKRAAQEQRRRQNADRIYARWQQQSEACRHMYPDFDLQSECAAPETGQRFLGLLKGGVDVQTAYEVVHRDQIIGGAMQITAQAIQQKTVNDIRARGMRPDENGASGTGTATLRADPKAFTRKDREAISRRVMRGERISF